MNKENFKIDEDLVGYGLITLLIFSGGITVFKFNGVGDWIGLFLVFIGFIFLSVQLQLESKTEYCFTPLGIAFLIVSIFISNSANLFLQILFILFISFSIAFFVTGILYSSKKKNHVPKKESNSTFSLEFKEIAFKIIDSIGIMFSIIEISQKIFGN